MAPPRIASREPNDQRSNLTPNRRAAGSTRVRPTLRHQTPVPSQQRRRRDDEGPPACPRQQSAGRGEQEPVGPRHCWTAGLSAEDGEFVPQRDDFQILALVRPNPQGRELKNPAKHTVKQREKHEAGREPPYSTPQPPPTCSSTPRRLGETRDPINAPFTVGPRLRRLFRRSEPTRGGPARLGSLVRPARSMSETAVPEGHRATGGCRWRATDQSGGRTGA